MSRVMQMVNAEVYEAVVKLAAGFGPTKLMFNDVIIEVRDPNDQEKQEMAEDDRKMAQNDNAQVMGKSKG